MQLNMFDFWLKKTLVKAPNRDVFPPEKWFLSLDFYVKV